MTTTGSFEMNRVARSLMKFYGHRPVLSLTAYDSRSQYLTTSVNNSNGNFNQTSVQQPSKEDINGGRVLARLAKMAHKLKLTIESDKVEQDQLPELIFDLEQDVKAAYSLISSALDKVGRPCTVEELGDRTHENIVPFPANALDYVNYMRATNLRDELERSLVNLDVFPPEEAFIEGEGKIFCRIERKAARDREAQTLLTAPTENAGMQNKDGELPELRALSKDELQRRKKYLEESVSLSNILRGFDTALLQVGRVHKVVKQGTTMSMRALVVIGNRKGTAGYGEGKSETAQRAIERACRDAKRNLLHLDLYQDRTIFHRVVGNFICCKVSLWPKPKGSGITANNNYAAIFQLFGLKDIGAKQHGSRNLPNAVKALFNGLSKLETPESICASRGLKELAQAPPLKRKPKFRPL